MKEFLKKIGGEKNASPSKEKKKKRPNFSPPGRKKEGSLRHIERRARKAKFKMFLLGNREDTASGKISVTEK